MPSRLRPTAPFAADALLVGDPGRALLLAQRLLEQPKMSNHARGLWGYSGRTPGGDALTIQATGIGGPSAALILAELAELGVKRAVRVGTGTGLAGRAVPGELLSVSAALAVAASVTPFGLDVGDMTRPDPDLLAGLEAALGGEARTAIVASLDTAAGDPDELPDTVDAADLQTATVLARGPQLGIATAAVLVVSESSAGAALDDEALEAAANRAGEAAASALSNPKVEG